MKAESLRMGLVPLQERPQKAPSCLPSCEDMARRQPSMNQEMSPHQTLTLP